MSDAVQAAATAVTLVVAVVAVWVAWVAKNVAEASNVIAGDARDAEKDQARIADAALTATRRQTELGAVPNLVVRNPTIRPPNGSRPQRLNVSIENGGSTVAYGVILSAAVAATRDLGSIDEKTRGSSRREPGLQPGAHLQMLSAPLPTLYGDWIAVRVEWYSPLGAAARHDYLWSRTEGKWRLHRVVVKPESGPPLTFDLELGVEQDDEPEDKPPFGASA
jgi:hypothetical protein